MRLKLDENLGFSLPSTHRKMRDVCATREAARDLVGTIPNRGAGCCVRDKPIPLLSAIRVLFWESVVWKLSA